MRNQPFVLQWLVNLNGLTVNEVLVLTTAYARPRHAVVRKLSDGNRRLFCKYVGNFLIGTPVGPAYGVEEMQVWAIALCFYAIAKRRLHAALRCAAVTAARRHKGKNHRLLPSGGGFDSAALTGEASAYNENVSADQLRRHGCTSLSRNASGGSSQPARTNRVSVPTPSTNQKMICSRRCRPFRLGNQSEPHFTARRYRPTLA